jgi:galactonate dehydratase
MNRRDFLAAGGAGLPFAAQPMAQPEPRYSGKPALKITNIQPTLAGVGGRNLCFVKVLTDQGLYGWGEAYSVGPDEATVATIRDFKSWLVGKDPRNVEYLWATMYNFTRFPPGAVIMAAISGIEHALWDIAGKAAGLPVYMLLGGRCRDKVRVYQSAGGSTPEELAASAKNLIAKYGYTAVKMAPHPPGSHAMPYNAVTRAAGLRAEAVRAAVGPDIDLCFDAHATLFEPSRALAIAEALKPARPLFLEEPIRMENIDALAALKHRLAVPLATGECLYTKYDFRQILEKQAADIIQPDILQSTRRNIKYTVYTVIGIKLRIYAFNKFTQSSFRS